MVRAIKAAPPQAIPVRSLNKGERAVLFPGPLVVEPWEVWVLSSTAVARYVQVCNRALDNPLRKNSNLALPVAQVFCLPLWLNEVDAKQFAGMIPLQLELRGLLPRGNNPAVFEYSVIVQDSTRTLLMIAVLPSSLPEELHSADYQAFDLSARYLAFPESSMIIWREQGQLVIAFTRGNKLVYFQALRDDRISTRALQDLTSIRATLAMQGILNSLQQLMVWTDVTPSELTSLQTTLQLPIRQAKRPSPAPPSSVWKLTPSIVNEAKRSREVQGWRTKGLLLGLGIYLLVVVLLLGRLFVTSYKVETLRQWHSEHAQAIALVHDTQAAWKTLHPVVDESSYPLELLLNCSTSIPADQLHLTLFEANNGNLLIKGEAKNASAAFQFLENLKRDSHFAGYSWDMSQPHLLPNDLAQLQIEGTRATTN